MRVFAAGACALVLSFALSAGPTAQGGPPPAQGAQGAARGGGKQGAGGPDPVKVVAGGGVFVAGWTGKVDAAEAANGQVLNNSKLAQEGAVLHVTTGPSTTYWNPANKATGDYTVKATFTEPKYMSLNDPSASVRHRDRRQRSRHAAAELPLLRGLRQRQLHRARIRTVGRPVDGQRVSDERRPRRGERRGQQGRRPRRAGHAGNRGHGQGRQRRVHDQRHGRRERIRRPTS